MTPLRFLMILIGSIFLVFFIIGYYIYDAVSYNMPSLEQLENPKQNLATQVLSADGEVLDHFYIERKSLIAD